MKVKNLFDLNKQEQEQHLRLWAELLDVGTAWEVLASVRQKVEPHFADIARRISEHFRKHPFTESVGDITAVFMGVMPYYFGGPQLSQDYLQNRAQAGKAYLAAGFTPSTLVAKYGVLLAEWQKVFEQFFPENAELQLRLKLALTKVAVFNLAVALEQFTYEREEKFLRSAGISRELFEQMARIAE